MALVTKILEETLTAGQTSVVFTDTDIPNSLIRVFSSNSDIIPVSRILSGNSLTVTYDPQTFNMDVALEIVKQGLDIVDNVLSEDTDKALSAKQGYLLSAAIGDVDDGLSTLTETVNNLDIPDNITDLDDVNVTSIQDGQVLAWDAIAEKFKNVSQGSSAFNLIKKAWTATASSASGTVLTESANLEAGLYIINVHNAYSVNNVSTSFALTVNGNLEVDTIGFVASSYGNYTYILKLDASATIAYASAAGTVMSWDSQYLDRGGMNILKIS